MLNLQCCDKTYVVNVGKQTHHFVIALQRMEGEKKINRQFHNPIHLTRTAQCLENEKIKKGLQNTELFFFPM